MMDEDGRFPLCPMQDNILAGSEPPPSISVELPAALKGENLEADTSLAPSRAGSAVPTEESRSPLTRLPENASTGSGVRPPSAELFYKGESLDAELVDGTSTEEGSRSESPPCEPPSLDDLEGEELPDEEEEGGLFHSAAILEVSVDKDAQNAIHALLALQREPSPLAEDRSRSSSPEPSRKRPLSPWEGAKSCAIQKGAAVDASRYFCKFPRCGKAYASTDAVRKHCRQRHLDWLRRLGHGCPALYCSWDD